VNAFAVGCADQAAVAVTDGLLRSLTLEELAGVLAHEVAHIRNCDTWTMAQAQSMTTATELVSFFGLALLHGSRIPAAAPTGRAAAIAAFVLTLAPAISRLLQLALSRTREFDADLDAIELAGDVFGLARALEKLEYHHAPAKTDIPTPHDPVASLFRTHPETMTRVRHLLTAGTA
jgi:heat shock protein HtpX